MPNEESSDVSNNVEKNAVKDNSQEQAQESTRSEAVNSFAEGQGKAASAERESNTQREVQNGALPNLNLFDSYREHMQKKEAESGQAGADHSKHEHKHRHGAPGKDSPADEQKQGDKPGTEEKPQEDEIVDPNASDRFKQQSDRTNQSVLRQMPEHLRDMMKTVPVDAVKSITHKDGDPINAMHGADGIKLAEKREGGAPLETVLKHEYGHEFDMRNGETPHSANPEFRNLIDKAMKDPHMRKFRDQDPDQFHAEVFADLFASNLGSRSQHLNIPYSDKMFGQAREWVKQKMMEGARKK
ncbi:MAG: hypothetical protein K2X77_24090 [Candidatus Obscuribacterales bacterium]|nr:hypothetical protein [Candidatus Obscuribacterales bacterium]